MCCSQEHISKEMIELNLKELNNSFEYKHFNNVGGSVCLESAYLLGDKIKFYYAMNLLLGKDISFELGSTYNIENYKKTIDALSIQNNQTSSSNTSNTNNSSLNLFTTNKIQVTFNLTADKHNFVSFYNDNFNTYKSFINNEDLDYLTTSIFNNLPKNSSALISTSYTKKLW
jgi:hypothetical protein